MAFLLGISGTAAQQRFDLKDDNTTIGRGPDNTIIIKDDAAVSSSHCCVAKKGDAFVAQDLGSTNGTTVNDVLIENEVPLRSGDIIGVGACEMQFNLDDTAVVTPPAPKSITETKRFPGGGPSRPADAGPSPFNTRKNTKGLWMVIIGIAIAIAIVVLGYVFLTNLFLQ